MYVAVLVLFHPTPQLLIKIIPPTSTQELAPLLCGSTSYLCCDTQLTLQVKVTGVSLVPTPCVFIACSTKFAQRAWAHSSRDVCHSRIFTSPDNVLPVEFHCIQWSFKLKQVKRVR